MVDFHLNFLAVDLLVGYFLLHLILHNLFLQNLLPNLQLHHFDHNYLHLHLLQM
jgi:hypothetical protein